MMNWITLAMGVILFASGWKSNQQTQPPTHIPAVFLLVDADHFDEELASAYPVTLLQAFNNNTQQAFFFWRSFSQRIQSSIKEGLLDDQCAQVWIKAYWDRNGKLIHIGYSTESKYQQDPGLDDLFNQEIAGSETSGSWSNGFYHFGCIKIK